MNRPSRRFRVLVATLTAALLAAIVSAFSTIGSAETNASAQQYGPQNSSPPTISGTAREGSLLTAATGIWTSSATITYTYQFRRCNAGSNNCSDITGANSRTYRLTRADVGRRIKVRVIATSSAGTASAESGTTNVVAAQQPTTTGGTIAASAVVLPNRLVIDRVSFSPSPIRSRDPFTARFRVTDTRGVPVTGALVYATGVPFGRLVQPPETTTDGQGFATMTIQPTRLLPLRNGFLLTMFLRARKAGDDLLAGVSTRRLVSIRTASP